MQRITVGLALAALVAGTMIAATGTSAVLTVGLVFVGLGLGVVAAITWVDRGIKS
jgi:predicted MFS family arabinose efflux permease